MEVVGHDDGFVSRGAVIGREVGRGGICCHFRISLIKILEGDTVVWFCVTYQKEGAAYYIGGRGRG